MKMRKTSNTVGEVFIVEKNIKNSINLHLKNPKKMQKNAKSIKKNIRSKLCVVQSIVWRYRFLRSVSYRDNS